MKTTKSNLTPAQKRELRGRSIKQTRDSYEEQDWCVRTQDPLRFRAWMKRVHGWKSLVNVIYSAHGLPNRY